MNLAGTHDDRLFAQLKSRYPVMNSCKCHKTIVIYEGEFGNTGIDTTRAIQNWPIKDEEAYHVPD